MEQADEQHTVALDTDPRTQTVILSEANAPHSSLLPNSSSALRAKAST
jgi:hypothetical protein